MSTELATAQSNLPTAAEELRRQLAAEAEKIAERLGAPSTNRIKLDNKSFKLPDGSIQLAPAEFVIIDFTYHKRLYESGYRPGDDNGPPLCFAINSDSGKLTPHPDSPEIQCEADCKACPMNQWGSDGKGKACKDSVVLSVIPVSFDGGSDAEGNQILYTMKVPTTAVRGFETYVSQVSRMYSVPPYGVISKIDFDSKVTYSKPLFSVVGPNEAIVAHHARLNEARPMTEVGPNLTPTPEVPEVKRPAKAQPIRGRKS